jgi:hypothetical protein
LVPLSLLLESVKAILLLWLRILIIWAVGVMIP